MISHAPSNYECPFCDWLAGSETPYKQSSDIIYQDEQVTAFVAPKWWMNNPGGIIVIPNCHYENIYDIPDDVLCRVYKTVKRVSLVVRSVYPDCAGTSTRQHNEPAGNQDVWHFHVHVFARYKNDRLYQNHDNKRFVDSDERSRYADILRPQLSSVDIASSREHLL